MPYADLEKRRKVKRESERRRQAKLRQARVVQVVREREVEVPKVLPDPPDEDELVRILGVQARLGSVQAAKLLLERIAKENGGDSKPGSVIESLAKRRAARAG